MRLSGRFIVSPRYDLAFFIGSCVLTWLFLGLYHGLRRLGVPASGESILITYFLFTALFDHPHIFQTFSRTHADPTEFRRHRRLHTWGLGAFVVVGAIVTALGFGRQLIVVAAIYGSWHIIRQHWGLLRAYKARNDDTGRADHVIDSLLFYAGMIGFLLHDYVGPSGETEIYGPLRVTFPSVPGFVSEGAFGLFLVALAVFVVRQTVLAVRGQPINLPKLLFLAAALGTHGLVFYATATPFLVAEALETAYHNAQYQGWIMHFQRRRFGARSVLRWAVLALAYGFVVGVIEVVGLATPALSWLFVPFSMVVIYHYYVDGKIWRLGQDPELRRAVLRGA